MISINIEKLYTENSLFLILFIFIFVLYIFRLINKNKEKKEIISIKEEHEREKKKLNKKINSLEKRIETLKDEKHAKSEAENRRLRREIAKRSKVR